MATAREILATLDEEVTKLQTSETFLSYLTIASRFHKYSLTNQLLIWAANPRATYVAGYTTWQKLGRQVKKGEKGIAIVVPHRRKAETEDGESVTSVSSFGVGYVFDISQTDGDPLPELSVPVLDSEAGGDLYAALAQVARDEGISITVEPDRHFADPETMGYYQPGQQHIAVRGRSPLQMVKTLAHELGHHFDPGIKDYQAARGERETVAESVAYVVLAYFGLDSGERSFPYVASWAQKPELFRKVLAEIQHVSSLLIEKTTAVRAGRTAVSLCPEVVAA